jgi:hypothetical protein
MTNTTALLRFKSLTSLALLIVLAAFVGLFMTLAAYDWQGMLLVLAGIGILSVFLLPRLARVEGGGLVLKILMLGLLLKMVFSMLNLYFAVVVYGGTADALSYSRIGTTISQYIWRLEFDKVVPFLTWGTDFINFFTGVVYSIIGPSIYGGFFVYALISFLGSYFYYRAFRTAFPDGNKWLYLVLVFLFPSILFWSSVIGKDALMALFLGLFAYGAAQLVQNQLKGLVPAALGFTGALWIRPHIAAISILAFALALFLPGARKRHFSPVTYVIGLLGAAGLTWLLLPQVMSFLNLKGLSPDEIIAYIGHSQVYTDVGQSTFQALNLSNPLSYLMIPITLLFRPFPWEAHNLQALFESLTGVLILVLVLWRIKSLGRAMAHLVSDTYVRYLLIYIIVFCIIFAVSTNFGTLARERVMMQPFFFMLLCFGPSGLPEKRPRPAAAPVPLPPMGPGRIY